MNQFPTGETLRRHTFHGIKMFECIFESFPVFQPPVLKEKAQHPVMSLFVLSPMTLSPGNVAGLCWGLTQPQCLSENVFSGLHG